MTHKCKTKLCKREIEQGWFCDSCHRKREAYCPSCFAKLDNSDSCWLRCEYESHEAMPPFNKVEAYQNSINRNLLTIKIKRHEMIRLTNENIEMQKVIDGQVL